VSPDIMSPEDREATRDFLIALLFALIVAAVVIGLFFLTDRCSPPPALKRS
jgi:hypothetical protein